MTVNAAGGLRLRKHAFGYIQLGENLIVPLQGIDVKQHGAGGVGIVGHMYGTLCELPDKPGLNGSE